MMTVKLDGVEDVLDRMAKLSVAVQRRAATKAARAGASVISNKAKTIAKTFDDPKTPNRIWRNIAVQSASKLGRQEGGAAMRIGIRGGARNYVNSSENRRLGRVGKAYLGGGSSSAPGGDTFYWRFLEFGTSKMKAKPFLRPAASSEEQNSFDATAKRLDEEIDKEIRGL